MPPYAAGTSPLEALPGLVLDRICECFVTPNDGWHNLKDLSLTSTQLAIATRKFRFRRMNIRLSTEAKLREFLDRLDAAIREDDRALRYVQQVKLRGALVGDQEIIRRERSIDWADYGAIADDVNRERDPKDKVRDFFQPPAGEWYSEVSGTDFGQPSPFEFGLDEAQRRRQEEAWKPLVKVIAKLPVLRDVVYVCLHQVPLSLLTTLHNHSSSVRLHIQTFKLRSLCVPEGQEPEVDGGELAIATSPCLYSIVVPHGREGFGFPAWEGYNYHAAKILMAGAAPNLAKVELRGWGSSYNQRITNPAGHRTFRRLYESRPGLARDSRGGVRELRTAEAGNSSMDAVDIGKLTSLDVRSLVANIRPLIPLAPGFESLRSLRLRGSGCTWFTADREDDFIWNLPPLETVEIDGDIKNHTFEAVLARHGKTLKRFRFRFARAELLPLNIQALAVSCPNLEDLAIEVLREPEGNTASHEVGVYRALSGLARLKRVRIGVSLDRLRVKRDSLMAIQDEAGWANLLRECAFDSRTARAVFDMASGGGGVLESLELAPIDFPAIGSRNDASWDFLLSWVLRKWYCQREPGAAADQVVVDETESCRRPSEDSIVAFLDSKEPGKKIWKRAWPSSSSAASTRSLVNAWSSSPLPTCIAE